MTDPGREPRGERAIVRVSHALVGDRERETVRGRLRVIKLWVLLDAPRWALVTAFAVAVFATTTVVGLFGPASVQQFLLEGTTMGDMYNGLEQGLFTTIVVVLTINQLVLSPEFGSLGHQQKRLEDVLSHQRDVAENAGVACAPTDPSSFLRTILTATRDHLRELETATPDDGSREHAREIVDCIETIRREVDPVDEALADQEFGRIGLFGAAIHVDTTHNINRIRELRRAYTNELSAAQVRAIDDLLDALKQFDVAREHFRTRYIQTQFIRFSLWILLTGVPALLVAHYAGGIIGPGVLAGTTFGVRDLLWFESAAFTVTMLPVAIIVAYVARLVALGRTSIFQGPFTPDESGD